MSAEELPVIKNKVSSKGLRIMIIVAAVCITLLLLSIWWIKYNLYANPFRATKLTVQEQQVLDEKLDHLQRNIPVEGKSSRTESAGTKGEGSLAPEPYKEEAARREINITERELNALIARDKEIARRVAVDLSNNMVSLKVLIPVDKEIPVLGGKILRLNCGITLGYEEGKPVVVLRGVSIGGVPIPNAWLGNIKDMDLVQEFEGQGGFWDIFSQGVEYIKVSDGSFHIKLKE